MPTNVPSIAAAPDGVAELALAISASMRVLRERHRSVAAFAAALAARTGRAGLSRQAIYDWERGRSQVTAAIWIAAAELAGMTLDEALTAGWHRARPAFAERPMLEGTGR